MVGSAICDCERHSWTQVQVDYSTREGRDPVWLDTQREIQNLEGSVHNQRALLFGAEGGANHSFGQLPISLSALSEARVLRRG
jgi:hypothetical protein